MPQNHTIKDTNIAVQIPAYTDIADGPKAFIDAFDGYFPHSVVKATGNVTAKNLDVIVVDSAAATTVTLPTPVNGDKTIVVQGGKGVVTVNAGTAVTHGNKSTDDQFHGLTAVCAGGEWWCLPFSSGSGKPRVGAPGAPVLAADLTFTVPAAGAAGPIFGFGADVSPKEVTDSKGVKYTVTVAVDQVNHKLTVAGTVPFTDYTFDVFAVNAAGAGPNSNSVTKQFNYNVATGGTVTDVPNYNGTGQKWRVHRFNGNADLNVTASLQPWRVLIIGGGGHGGAGGTGGVGGGGQGGFGGSGVDTTYQAVNIPVGVHPVVVGGSDGASSLLGNVAPAGAAGANQNSGGPGGNGNITTSNATGTPMTLAMGGPGNTGTQTQTPNTGNGGSGMPQNSGGNQFPPGASGIVVVAYQIG